MALSKHGFEDERFETAVAQSLHCSICQNVFKQPVMCRRNQHLFCRTCITEHLNNSRTCPLCRDELTAETLSEAPRVLTDSMSELNIRCDYFKRGCREVMQLGDLERHVEDCGFVAVICSNEGCRAEINKRDRIHHETEVCEFRKVQCHNCAETREELRKVGNEVGQLKISMEDVKVNLSEMKEQLGQQAILQDQMRDVQLAQEKILREVEGNKTNYNILNEMNEQLGQLAKQVRGMQTAQENTSVEVEAMKTDETNKKDDVVVAGGWMENSVTAFNLEKISWTTLQPMKECRWKASSFVYNKQLVVAGGYTHCGETNNMEVMNIDPVSCSTPWLGFPAELPARLCGHKSVVYSDHLITLGGYDGNTVADTIHEVQLVPPYASTLLTEMPEPRLWHGVELFHDKILIVGGSKTQFCKDAMASVMMYDINKNECKQMAPLPFAVCDMATVSWGDNVIIIGGRDQDSKTLDTVVIYNVKAEKSHLLPAMKCKRAACTAVITGNTIVVIGGRDEEHYLNSVEQFSFERYFWEDLPSMNKARCGPTAVAV